ncbi:MAG: PLP-dependent transferase, partial [Steroidobacteraceae bacterium]|nr:PLP-dependent transferase [Steroidobacteraceae bacterium]
QCRRAQRIAEFLAQHPAVARVHYPGLPTHPRHALARRQMREFGSIVAFDLDRDADFGRRFAEALQLFAITASLGSTESLVVPPQMMHGRGDSAEVRAVSGVTNATIRLSIGLEDPEELCADLARALERAEHPSPA